MGIDIPTFTCDGPTKEMLEAGSLPGSAVGLDSGSSLVDFDLACQNKSGCTGF